LLPFPSLKYQNESEHRLFNKKNEIIMVFFLLLLFFFFFFFFFYDAMIIDYNISLSNTWFSSSSNCTCRMQAGGQMESLNLNYIILDYRIIR
jgi:hypothetical protein